jgi:hypothetical protein
MNPLLNEQLGQVTHREYEAKYSQESSQENLDKVQNTFPSWQKLAVATGSIAALIILASLIVTG